MVMEREGSGARYVPPPGFTFDPTDQKLISAYLDPYANGCPFENDWLFQYDDVYRTEPWNLLAAGEKKAYFFTSRRTKGGNIDRTAGRGSWKMQGGKNIDSNPVGHKNQLTFHIDRQRKTTGWVMHEYLLGPKDRKNANLQPIALCRIVRKARAVVPDVQARDEGVGRKRSCAAEDPTTSHTPVRRRVFAEGCVMSSSSVHQRAYSAEDPSTSHAPLCCRVIGDGMAMPHDCFASPSCIELPTYNSSMPADQPVNEVHTEPGDFNMINGEDIHFMDDRYERQDEFTSGLNEQLDFLNAETDNNLDADPDRSPNHILDVVEPSSTRQNIDLVTEAEAPNYLPDAIGPSTKQNIDAGDLDCLVTELEELIPIDDIIVQPQHECRDHQQGMNESSDGLLDGTDDGGYMIEQDYQPVNEPVGKWQADFVSASLEDAVRDTLATISN